MIRKLIAISFTVFTSSLLLACGSTEPASREVSQKHEGPAPVAADFSTPEGTVKAFFKGCADRDLEAISRCFSKDAAGEFRVIIDKTATAKELDELYKMFKDASIAGTKRIGEERADVGVLLPNHPRGKETLSLLNRDGTWKILDF